MIESSGCWFKVEVRRTLWTKSTTVGPTRTARVLAMIRATFFETVFDIVDFLVDSKACCAFGEAVEREDIVRDMALLLKSINQTREPLFAAA